MSIIVRAALALAISASLAGCAGPSGPPVPERVMTAADYAAAVSETRDVYEKTTRYKAPATERGGFDTVLLRAWQVDGGPVLYQLYVSDHYDQRWRFYHSAHDSAGRKLSMTQISREVSYCGRYGCTYFETVGLNIDRAYLEGAVQDGMSFKLSGKAGEEYFYVSGDYIKGFLVATEKASLVVKPI